MATVTHLLQVHIDAADDVEPSTLAQECESTLRERYDGQGGRIVVVAVDVISSGEVAAD